MSGFGGFVEVDGWGGCATGGAGVDGYFYREGQVDGAEEGWEDIPRFFTFAVFAIVKDVRICGGCIQRFRMSGGVLNPMRGLVEICALRLNCGIFQGLTFACETSKSSPPDVVNAQNYRPTCNARPDCVNSARNFPTITSPKPCLRYSPVVPPPPVRLRSDHPPRTISLDPCCKQPQLHHVCSARPRLCAGLTVEWINTTLGVLHFPEPY